MKPQWIRSCTSIDHFYQRIDHTVETQDFGVMLVWGPANILRCRTKQDGCQMRTLGQPPIPRDKAYPQAIIHCQSEGHSLPLNHTIVAAHSIRYMNCEAAKECTNNCGSLDNSQRLKSFLAL